MSQPSVYHGEAAVRQVETLIDRALTYAERRVVLLEGYVDGIYLDTKGIQTGYVGQTGEWIEKGFEAAFTHHVERVARRFPLFHNFPEYLKAELIQAEYRGDLGESPKTCRLINEGAHACAAVEFCENAEYRSASTPSSIKSRMEGLKFALLLYSVQ